MPKTLLDINYDSPSAEALAADVSAWRLYESSFPPTEREPPTVILDSLRKGVGFAIRARATDSTIGLATTHVLKRPAVLFLVYLAVAPEFRSRHIGTELFKKVWNEGMQWYSKWGGEPLGMVWEVDMPARAASEEELQQRHRRIAFFARLGTKLWSGPYFQPPVNGIDSIPMHLMFRPVAGGPMLDNTKFLSLVRAMYIEKYHQTNKIPRTILDDLVNEIEAGL